MGFTDLDKVYKCNKALETNKLTKTEAKEVILFLIEKVLIK